MAVGDLGCWSSVIRAERFRTKPNETRPDQPPDIPRLDAAMRLDVGNASGLFVLKAERYTYSLSQYSVYLLAVVHWSPPVAVGSGRSVWVPSMHGARRSDPLIIGVPSGVTFCEPFDREATGSGYDGSCQQGRV